MGSECGETEECLRKSKLGRPYIEPIKVTIRSERGHILGFDYPKRNDKHWRPMGGGP